MAQVLNNIPSSIWDHAVPGVELQHSLPSQVKAIAPVIDRFMCFISDLPAFRRQRSGYRDRAVRRSDECRSARKS